MNGESLLNELKSLICAKAGLNYVTPADCRKISLEIRKEFNKNVSETTLKRFFGFAAMKFDLSKYTITALCEYVGRTDFVLPIIHGTRSSDTQEDLWQNFLGHADRITRFTMKNITCRSALPYQNTISRRFAENAFEEFCENKDSLMVYIAPAGYGKTILLSHLVSRYFLEKGVADNRGIVLFVKAKLFLAMNKEKSRFEDRLKVMLGIPEDQKLEDFVLGSGAQKRFFLIVDDYTEQAAEFLNKLVPGPVKVIMGLSPADWVMMKKKLKISVHESFVPLMMPCEVERILSNSGLCRAESNLSGLLSFPFYIPFYLQFVRENLVERDNWAIVFQEVLTRFIKEKIYKSGYYTEKILLIKKMVQQMNYGVQVENLAHDEFKIELMIFKNAYSELLSDGILIEENKELQNMGGNKTIRFLDRNIFDYFLFIELLEQFNLNVDLIFLRFINRVYAGSEREFALLKWSVRYMVKTSNPNVEEYISRLELEWSEKKEMKMLLV